MQPLDIAATFADFGMDRDLIDRITQHLQLNTSILDDSQIIPVSEGSFGPTKGGVEMGRQTALAHAFVVDAITSIAGDLQASRKIVLRLEEESRTNDRAAADSFQTVPAPYHPPATAGSTTREA